MEEQGSWKRHPFPRPPRGSPVPPFTATIPGPDFGISTLEETLQSYVFLSSRTGAPNKRPRLPTTRYAAWRLVYLGTGPGIITFVWPFATDKSPALRAPFEYRTPALCEDLLATRTDTVLAIRTGTEDHWNHLSCLDHSLEVLPAIRKHPMVKVDDLFLVVWDRIRLIA